MQETKLYQKMMSTHIGQKSLDIGEILKVQNFVHFIPPPPAVNGRRQQTPIKIWPDR
jgi:hypothetical protein